MTSGKNLESDRRDQKQGRMKGKLWRQNGFHFVTEKGEGLLFFNDG